MRSPGNTFDVTAKWPEGEHTKVFDPAWVIRMGRVSCAKEYAMTFVREVLQKRGVL